MRTRILSETKNVQLRSPYIAVMLHNFKGESLETISEGGVLPGHVPPS